jgi:hypothetical protein
MRWIACAALVLLWGCRDAPEAPDWPDAALVSARGPALEQLLGRLAALDGTPLGRYAARLADALPDCEVVVGRSGEGLLAALEQPACGAPPPRLDALRGERDAAFALPLPQGGHLLGTLSLAASGDVTVELTLPADALAGPRRLLVPGDTPPGPGVLSSDGAIVHARLRPDGGIDVASLVPEEAQAERLFRLKSELFAGVVLDGTWELAVYLPAQGRGMPDMAAALGFRRRAPAVTAMEGFLRDLLETWPVTRTPFAVGDAEGACLLDLTVLPELAPCYVAAERALVVGWNPDSVRRALADGARSGPEGGLVLELARFREADARLAARRGAAPAGTDWPWRRLRAEGRRQGEDVLVQLVLEGGSA